MCARPVTHFSTLSFMMIHILDFRKFYEQKNKLLVSNFHIHKKISQKGYLEVMNFLKFVNNLTKFRNFVKFLKFC